MFKLGLSAVRPARRHIASRIVQQRAAYLSLWHPPAFENEAVVSHDTNLNIQLLTAKQKEYRKGSPERAELSEAIKTLKSQLPVRVPILASGKTVSLQKHYLDLD